MTRRALAALALALAACSVTLPPAAPHAFLAPKPSSASGVRACWIEFAKNEQPGAYGIAGESDHLHWHITVSGILIHHPKGDVLVDAGNSSRFSSEIASSDVISRALLAAGPGSNEVVAPAPVALLTQGGERESSIAFVLLSHAHPDHAGGLLDLPFVRVLASPDEIEFARREKDKGGAQVVRAHGDAIVARAAPIAFKRAPYEIFDESADLYDDGSIVIVPMPGHTPGSIGTFVTIGGLRVLHVGDVANTMEAIEKRRGKALPLEWTDFDEGATDREVARLNALHATDPALVLLPAHDRDAWVRLFGAPGRCIPR